MVKNSWVNTVPWKIFTSVLELVMVPQDIEPEFLFSSGAVGGSIIDRGGPCSMAAVLGTKLGIPLFHHAAAFRDDKVLLLKAWFSAHWYKK